MCWKKSIYCIQCLFYHVYFLFITFWGLISSICNILSPYTLFNILFPPFYFLGLFHFVNLFLLFFSFLLLLWPVWNWRIYGKLKSSLPTLTFFRPFIHLNLDLTIPSRYIFFFFLLFDLYNFYDVWIDLECHTH